MQTHNACAGQHFLREEAPTTYDTSPNVGSRVPAIPRLSCPETSSLGKGETQPACEPNLPVESIPGFPCPIFRPSPSRAVHSCCSRARAVLWERLFVQRKLKHPSPERRPLRRPVPQHLLLQPQRRLDGLVVIFQNHVDHRSPAGAGKQFSLPHPDRVDTPSQEENAASAKDAEMPAIF